jgi:tetratricopeptide (TPR) repeat protein
LVGSPFEQLNRFLPYQLSTRNAQPATSQPSDSEGGTESGEIRKIVWKGALDIARHYPLFGSGVETFAYSYYQFRPKEHNLVSEWDFLYNKAHNEYLNYAATTGFVGLGTYLLFVVAFVWWFIRMYPNLDNPNKSEYIILALFSGWLSILITNFFGFSVVPVALYFYLIPAVCFAISSPFTQGVNSRQPLRLPSDTASSAGRSNNVQKLLIFLIVISTFYILNFAFRYWRADTFYAKAYQLAKTGGYKDAYDNYHRAINFLPSEPLYRSDLSYTTAVLAVLAFGQNEATLAGQLAEEAILQDAVALNTSPANLNFWKTRTRTYSTLGILDPRFKQKAIEALLGAKKLAPTDAKIVYNLGLLYDQVGESEKAIETLKETVTLKSNYRDAYYALAIMYHESGKNQEAIAQLELILKQFSPDDQMIKDKIKEWKTENKKITE